MGRSSARTLLRFESLRTNLGAAGGLGAGTRLAGAWTCGALAVVLGAGPAE